MKTIRIAKIAKCPVCGGRPKMLKNASKDFQVRCTQCEFKTGWMRKTDAVIAWYNALIKYNELYGKKKEEDTNA